MTKLRSDIAHMSKLSLAGHIVTIRYFAGPDLRRIERQRARKGTCRYYPLFRGT